MKVKGTWVYLYRVVDSQGATLEFLLRATCAAAAAKRFFLKALSASPTTTPRVITVDKQAASPQALQDFKGTDTVPAGRELQQVKDLNTLLEHDHRFLKRLVRPGLGFFCLETAWRTLQGYKIMHMIRKGPVKGVDKGEHGADRIHRQPVWRGGLS